MARNIEVLRNYFLGKDPQLKETMADNSLRLIGIEGKHFVIRTELIARLEDLKRAVDAEDTELQAQIDSLIRDLSAETLARSNKDTQLENKIDNEILQRQNADYGLQLLINHNLNRIVDLETWKRNTDFVLEDDLEEALENYYTKPEIIALISDIPRFSIRVVETLPIQDISETTIYLVPSQDPDTGNSYEEYIYVNQNWELIGTTSVELSDYYTKEEVDQIVANIGGTIIDVTENSLRIWDLDDGIYHLPSSCSILYKGATSQSAVSTESGTYLFIYTENNVKYWWGVPYAARIVRGWTSSSDGDYSTFNLQISYEEQSNKIQTISDSSTIYEYPSAKAVYDFTPKITYGTEELTPGVSELAEGTFYFQYE